MSSRWPSGGSELIGFGGSVCRDSMSLCGKFLGCDNSDIEALLSEESCVAVDSYNNVETKIQIETIQKAIFMNNTNI